MSDIERKEPVLCAFPVEGSSGFYNVWRYDKKSTERVLFMHGAESGKAALSAALQKIKRLDAPRGGINDY